MKFPTLFLKVKIVIATLGFFQIALGLQLPILYVFVLQIGGDLRHLGAMFAIYGVAYAFTNFFLSLRFLEYREYLLSGSLMLWGIYALLMYFVDNPINLYELQFLAGISTAIGRPGFMQIFILNTYKSEFVKVLGFYKVFGRTLGAISAFTSGVLGHYYAIRPLFLFMFLLAMISFVISLSLFKIKDRF